MAIQVGFPTFSGYRKSRRNCWKNVGKSCRLECPSPKTGTMAKRVPLQTRLEPSVSKELRQYCDRKKAVSWRIVNRAVRQYLTRHRPAGIKMEELLTPSDVVELQGNAGFHSLVEDRVKCYNLPPVTETAAAEQPISCRSAKRKSTICLEKELTSLILT